MSDRLLTVVLLSIQKRKDDSLNSRVLRARVDKIILLSLSSGVLGPYAPSPKAPNRLENYTMGRKEVSIEKERINIILYRLLLLSIITLVFYKTLCLFLLLRASSEIEMKERCGSLRA